ncbi:hypothetical protein VHEMI01973 [[Torrubiella] hemipterigena]|uniref:HNH nuclease domain-containing protein n=1 Tax=[Torrubiella] hemipterigena TaxID=1531966 RepID=A0A0A1SUF7_9HYPO|nr:hypothetical protein VHEMI01973 [[Torrubiella] hemipterigena]
MDSAPMLTAMLSAAFQLGPPTGFSPAALPVSIPAAPPGFLSAPPPGLPQEPAFGAPPVFPPPLPPVFLTSRSNAERQVEALQVMDSRPAHHFTRLEIAALCNLPHRAFTDGDFRLPRGNTLHNGLKALLALFFERPASDTEVSRSQASTTPTSFDSLENHPRNTTAKFRLTYSHNAQGVRDVREASTGACLITQSEHITVSYICPFRFNNTRENLNQARNVIDTACMFLPKDRHDALEALLAGGLGSSDRTFNMLRMNPWVAFCWRKCNFALEWVGSRGPLSVEDDVGPFAHEWSRAYLRVHVLNQVGRNMDEIIDNASMGFFDEMFSVYGGQFNPVESMRLASGIELESHLFLDVWTPHRSLVFTDVKTADLENMKLMIDLQFALVSTFRMAGGIDPQECPHNEEPLPNIDTIAPQLYSHPEAGPSGLLEDEEGEEYEEGEGYEAGEEDEEDEAGYWEFLEDGYYYPY